MKLATLCYLKDGNNGSTLMIHRNKKVNDYHQGKWNGLGGKMHPGESPEDCVVREVREEAGVVPEDLRLRGVITFPLFDGTDDWYVFVFTADRYSGKIAASREGELSWIPDRELLSLNLWEGDRIFIPWLSEEKFFSAKFIYEDKKFVSYEAAFY